MKPRQETFDPATRMVPRDWIPGSASARSSHRAAAHESRRHEPYKWMTTLSAPLAEARRCALQVFTDVRATLAYLYENDDKVVIRCTLPERQIRAELKPLDTRSTRIVVVTMQGSTFDRHTSGRLVEAIETKLEEACFLEPA